MEAYQITTFVNSPKNNSDDESISQALSTCRRIIDSFADSIFPPSDETIEMGGNQVSLGENRHQNRIIAFVHQRCESSSRKKKIRQNLSNLYGRVSTGVHNEVTAEEARALFLNTYLLMGLWLNRITEHGIAICIATAWHQEDAVHWLIDNPEWSFLIQRVSENFKEIEQIEVIR